MRKALRWAGIAFASGFALVLVLASTGFFVGKSRLAATYEVEPRVTVLPTDEASIERGRHIATTRGCLDCHTATGGGQVFLDIPPAHVVAPNLTRGKGGVGAAYRDGDWDRAIRYGVRPSGEALLPFMPYKLFHNLNDDDMAALGAFLKALPPVDNELPNSTMRFPGYLMMAMPEMKPAKLRAGLAEAPPAVIPPGPTAEYGRYLASTTCVECHGADLRGGTHPAPGAPEGPNLAPYGAMPVDALAQAVREGVAPGERQLTEYMPSKSFAVFSDEEIAALHAYLKSLSTS